MTTIRDVPDSQKAPRVEAAFLWPLVAWTVLGFGAIGYAVWVASRG